MYTGEPEQPRVVPASLALACQKSVPFDGQRSAALIDWMVPFVQHQSTLSLMKNPTEAWQLNSVDVLGGLSKIKQNAVNGVYTSAYDFEMDIFKLLQSGRDNHFNFRGPTM